AVLQFLAQRGDFFTGGAGVDAGQASQGRLDVGLGRTAVFDTVFQRALQVQTGRTAEDHQIQQRVTTQTVGAVYRYASHLAYCEQTVDDAVVTVQVLGNGLTMDIGSHATHHVVTGRDHRHRSGDRVNVGEGLGQFT